MSFGICTSAHQMVEEKKVVDPALAGVYEAMVKTTALLSLFVQSIALSQGHGPHTEGLERGEWMAARKDAFERSYRHLPMVSQFGEEALRATESEALFEFGLQRFLDGISLLLEPANPS